MKYIEVKIREKDKKRKKLTLFNLRDELVNFMYKDTVASSSRSDQYFYLLLYFASVQAGNKTLVEAILDAALPRFQNLNNDFVGRKRYLAKNEYSQSVQKQGLSDFFSYDIFFILCEAILEIESIENSYGDLYQDNTQLLSVMSNLKKGYRPLIAENYSLFMASRIKDERVDDYGYVHDLSKGVYRTIKMRNAKNLEVNLQKYTRVKRVTSESPIILEIIQIVDPQIIFDLWNKYHVVEYTAGVWKLLDGSPVLSGALGSIIGHPVIEKYNAWRATRYNKDDRDKRRAAKEAFDVAKNQHSDKLDIINLQLMQSIIDTNKHLRDEISFLRQSLEKEQGKGALLNEDEIKNLKNRIEKLENIEVETSGVMESDVPNRLEG